MSVTKKDPEKPDWLARMESVLEMLNEGVVVVNERQQILFANSRFLEMTSITPQDLKSGFDPSHLYSAQEWDFLRQQSDVTSRNGQNRYAFVLPRSDGSRLPVIVSSRTFRSAGTRLRVVTFTDISEQRRAEEQLCASNAKLQERQKEIDEDLRLAARVQHSLAPRSLVCGNLSVDAFYHPVHSIGGDFALVHAKECEHVSLLVGDVSGHGIGSALVANRIHSETKEHLRSGTTLTDMFRVLNRFIIQDIAGCGMFITVAAARIDAQQRRMIFAGAGHPPAMLARGGQTPILLKSRSMILGLLSDAVDVTGSFEVQLEPDDRIILYTDGLTEVFNSRGEMLGVEGLGEIVRQTSHLPDERMKQGILDGVAAWRNGPPTDDMSLVLVHVR